MSLRKREDEQNEELEPGDLPKPLFFRNLRGKGCGLLCYITLAAPDLVG